MRDAKLETDFGDGSYVFRLPWGLLVELQEKLESGPYAVFKRLLGDDWRVEDISETIRLGLIGGDKDIKPIAANKLVTRYVRERPLAENVPLARAILQVALFGAGDEEDKPKATEKSDEVETSDGKLNMKAIYGAGAAIGFSPQQVNEMSVYQFIAAVDGYVSAHSPEDKTLTDDEKKELFDLVIEHS
jgi:hypothetical protein